MHPDNDPPEADSSKRPPASDRAEPADGVTAPAPVRIPIHISRDPKEIIPTPPRPGAADDDASAGDILDVPYRRLRNGLTHIGRLVWGEIHEALAALEDPSRREISRARLPGLLHGFLSKLQWDVDSARVTGRPDGARVDVAFRFDFQELFALPWELTPVGPAGPEIGAVERCLISYERPGRRTEPRRPDVPGGRILVVTADAPEDPIPIQEHIEALAGACEASGIAFDPRTDVLRDASLAKVQAKLAERPARPTILHVLCHGALLPDGKTPGIALRSDAGALEVVGPGDLAKAIGEHAASVRLVVLCVCHSAAPGALDGPLGSLALEIHEQGVEAVIASRYLLSKDASIRFSRAFYRSLLRDLHSVQDAFLDGRSEVKKHVDARSLDDLALQLFAREEDGPDLRPIVFQPYRGLLAFEREHERFYFGRDEEIHEAVSEIAALFEDPKAPRLFFVTGASGRGKSSFVTAGVVPRLPPPPPRAGKPGEPPRAGRWHVEKTRPSAGLDELERALARAAGKDAVLIVDQLEEIVTSQSGDRAWIYFERLWRFATDTARRTLVLGALRVDFIPRMGELGIPGGTGTLEDVICRGAHHVLLAPMTEEALRSAIEKPARLAGLSFDEGLPNDIVRDAGNEPGVLPLVAYVLDQLWHRRRGARLTREAYEKMGRLRGALCGHAAEVYRALGKESPRERGKAGEARQSAARRILVALVESNDLSPLTRRVVPEPELRAMPGVDAQTFRAVLQTLEEARLVVVRTADAPRSDALCEIAHEMLIRDWDDLKEWVRDHRAKHRDLHHFEKIGASSDAIVRDGEFERLRDLVARPEVPIPPGVARLWERSRRARRRREIRIAATALALVLWAAFATYLWVEVTGERDDAKLEASAAREQVLISGAHGFVARGDHAWAAKLLLAVKEPDVAPGFVEAANEVLATRLPLRIFPGTLPAVSPDGERLFTAEAWTGRVLVHRTDGKGKPWSLPGTLAGIDGLAVSPDGTRVVGTSDGQDGLPGGVRVWRVAPGAPGAMVIAEASKPATSPVWSAGGQSFAAILADQPHVFAADGAKVRAVAEGPSPAHSIALSPDGRTLLVARSGDEGERIGAAEVWSLAPGPPCKGAPPCLVATLSEQAWSLGFSADGWRVFAAHTLPGGRLQVISVWSLDRYSSPEQMRPLPHLPPGTEGSVAWIDGERWLVTTGAEATVVESGDRPIRRLAGRWIARVSGDGEHMASASLTSAFVEARAPGAPMIELSGQGSLVSSLEIDPLGRFVVTSSSIDGTSRLFRLDGGGGVVFNLRDQGPLGLPEGVVLGAKQKVAILRFEGDDPSAEGPSYLVGLVPPFVTERLPPGRAELSPDERHLLFVDGGRATFAPVDDWRAPRPAVPEECSAIDAVFSRDAQHVFLLCDDGTLRKNSLSGGGPSEVLTTFEACGPEPQVSLSLAGESALVRCAAGDLRAFRPGAPPFELFDWCGPGGSWTLSPDGAQVACHDAGDTVALIQLSAPDAPRYLFTGSAAPRDFWFSRFGPELAVTTTDNEVVVLRPGPAGDVELPRHPRGLRGSHGPALPPLGRGPPRRAGERERRLSPRGSAAHLPRREPRGSARPPS